MAREMCGSSRRVREYPSPIWSYRAIIFVRSCAYGVTVMRTVWPCGANRSVVEDAGNDLEDERLASALGRHDPPLPHVGCDLGEAADEREDSRANLPNAPPFVGRAKPKIE